MEYSQIKFINIAPRTNIHMLNIYTGEKQQVCSSDNEVTLTLKKNNIYKFSFRHSEYFPINLQDFLLNGDCEFVVLQKHLNIDRYEM